MSRGFLNVGVSVGDIQLAATPLPNDSGPWHNFPTTPGWEEAWDLPNESQAQHTFMGDTLPDGPRENTIAYMNLFDFCDYKQDCSTVWEALGSLSVRIKWRNKV